MRKDVEWIARYYFGIDGDNVVSPPKLDLTRSEEVFPLFILSLSRSNSLSLKGFVNDVKKGLKQFPLSHEIFDNLLISRSQLVQDLFQRWRDNKVTFFLFFDAGSLRFNDYFSSAIARRRRNRIFAPPCRARRRRSTSRCGSRARGPI